MRKLLVTIAALILLCASLAQAADKKEIRPKNAERNAGWSHRLLVDDTLYVSGMGGEDAAGKIPDTSAVVRSKIAKASSRSNTSA